MVKLYGKGFSIFNDFSLGLICVRSPLFTFLKFLRLPSLNKLKAVWKNAPDQRDGTIYEINSTGKQFLTKEQLLT